MSGSRPMSRLRSKRTCPGMSSGVRRRGRVEPEDRLPGGGLRPEREAVRIADEHVERLRLAADVGRDERRETGGGVEIDPVERAPDRQADRCRAAVLDDGQRGCAIGRGLRQPREQLPVGVDEIAPGADLPDEDRRALPQTHREGVGQADRYVRRANGRQLADPRLERRCHEREQVRAARLLEHGADRGLVGEGGALDLRVRVAERRRLGHAVHRRRRQEDHQDRAGPDRGQPGRGAPDRPRSAGRRPDRSPHGRPDRRGTTRRRPRAQGHRGRSPVPSFVAGRAAWRSSASSTMRTHTSVNV